MQETSLHSISGLIATLHVHTYVCAHYYYAMPLSYIKSLHTCLTRTEPLTDGFFTVTFNYLKCKMDTEVIAPTHPLLPETIERYITYMSQLIYSVLETLQIKPKWLNTTGSAHHAYNPKLSSPNTISIMSEEFNHN